jgi:hypothetical protein
MPATSKAQQRLMGMAYALKKGDMKPEDASQEVKDLADSMTLKQLKDYAETKHEGLPDHVEESDVNEWLPGVAAGHKWYTQISQSNANYGFGLKDTNDPLIKSFIEFIESGKTPDEKEKTELQLQEDAVAPSSYSAPQSSPANTPGMGNVTPGGPGSIGSGDRFDNLEDEDEEKKKRYKYQAGIVNYETFKKMNIKQWQNQQGAKKAQQDQQQ